ncbi:MAG: DNA internalization-related competence protein ComEC/Rec2 [Johnsonella sp.]|nr:DNA internalization-related competence protein ComEC/Rec2 [Johnsonella sp.]
MKRPWIAVITAYVLGELLWHGFGFFTGIAAGIALPALFAWRFWQKKQNHLRNQEKKGGHKAEDRHKEGGRKEGKRSLQKRIADEAGRRLYKVDPKHLRAAFWLCMICSLASLRMYMQEWESPQQRDLSERARREEKAELEGRIEWIEEKGEGFVLRMGMLLLHMSREEAGMLQIGDLIRVRGRIADIEESGNPGEFDADAYYRAKKIFFKMRVEEVLRVKREGESILHKIYLLRALCKENLSKIFAPEDSGFLAAALLGDKTLLDRELYALYQKSGIAHLLAISGLHVSMMGLALYYLLRKLLCMKFWLCGGLAGGFLLFYGIFTGASVSVLRASLMLALVFIAEILGRSYDLLSACSIAAFAILLHSPGELFTAGFLLSFAAVLSIGGPLSYLSGECKIKNRLLSSLAAGVCIQSFTLPLIAYYFYRFPPYALILNLFVIPLMSILIALSLASLLISPFFFCLSQILAKPVHWILQLYLFLCEIFAKLPGSSILLGRPKIWQILLYYTVLSGGVFFLPRVYLRNEKEESHGRRGKLLLLLFLFMQLCVLLLFPLREKKTRICFLDVGQGDGIYMRVSGEDILIDCGSTTKKELGKYTLKPFLESMAVESIEKIFITHADKDHISALLWLFAEEEEMKVKSLYLPYPAKEDEDYLSIRKAADEKGIKIRYLSAGDRAEPFLCLSPRKDVSLENTNEQSLVLLYRENRFRALFTGDAGKASEEKILSDENFVRELSGIILLKIGHHGSYSASGEEFIRVLSPDYAVLSYGKKNPYGHPHREVLSRLWRYGIKSYETAKSGEIEFLTDGERIWIREWKKEE